MVKRFKMVVSRRYQSQYIYAYSYIAKNTALNYLIQRIANIYTNRIRFQLYIS